MTNSKVPIESLQTAPRCEAHSETCEENCSIWLGHPSRPLNTQSRERSGAHTFAYGTTLQQDSGYGAQLAFLLARCLIEKFWLLESFL